MEDLDRHDRKRLFGKQDRGEQRDTVTQNPTPVTRGQTTTLIILIAVVALVALRIHVSEQEKEAVRTFDNSLCWTHQCEVNVAIARLRS